MPRKRPAADRPRLTRHDILVAALKLSDAEGMAGLSMRRLAATLGVEAMSLYNHVRDKNDLVDGMVTLVLEQIPLPEQPLPWQETLRLFASSLYRAFVARPELVPALEHLEVYSPRVILGMEQVLGALDQAGLAPQEQVAAFRGLNSLVIGFVMGHTRGLSASREQTEAHWQAWDSQPLRESGLPNLTRLAPYFQIVQPEADFEYVLRRFIGALEQSK